MDYNSDVYTDYSGQLRMRSTSGYSSGTYEVDSEGRITLSPIYGYDGSFVFDFCVKAMCVLCAVIMVFSWFADIGLFKSSVEMAISFEEDSCSFEGASLGDVSLELVSTEEINGEYLVYTTSFNSKGTAKTKAHKGEYTLFSVYDGIKLGWLTFSVSGYNKAAYEAELCDSILPYALEITFKDESGESIYPKEVLVTTESVSADECYALENGVYVMRFLVDSATSDSETFVLKVDGYQDTEFVIDMKNNLTRVMNVEVILYEE